MVFILIVFFLYILYELFLILFRSDALQKNEEVEFERNKERFVFLKWGSQALKNMLIVPPGSGIVHQVSFDLI